MPGSSSPVSSPRRLRSRGSRGGLPSSPSGPRVAASSSPVRYGSSSSPPRQPQSASSPRSGTSHVGRTPSSSRLAATPGRSSGPRRGDLGLGPGPRVPVAPTSDDVKMTSTDHTQSGQSKVWGTNVNVATSMANFRRFFLEYKAEDDDEALYPQLLQETLMDQTYNINVNCKDLFRHNRQLYRELIRYPSEIIPIFDLALHNIIEEMHPQESRDRRTQVRTFNLMHIHNMRQLDPVDIDTMVAVKGMVIRVSQVTPEMRQAFFECSMCRHSAQVNVDRGRIQEPLRCANCQQDRTMTLIHNRCLFADRQQIKLQETPDSIPEGETPHTVTIYAYDDLVDIAKPGDRVIVTGIFKARSVRTNPRKRMVRSVYNTYIDVIHFQKTSKGSLSAESATVDKESEFYTQFSESNETHNLTEQIERELHSLARKPNIEELLVRSLAPSIWQMDDVKKGILCLLFGGTNKNLGNTARFRGELNILLCGDPGTSKSQLLTYVHKIAPRGIYTSGKGSSAVGLTAYITKDPDTKEMVLESGALVLSDRGVCCIDEFDKMNDTTRSILHEVMEQQTVSIAKAGIVATLNARTSILASANPIDSRYDPKKSVVENIDLPPTLLSRFDLVYLILDQPNDVNDRRLARHLVGLYYEDAADEEEKKDLIPTSTLTRYISYARSNIHPKLSDECVEELIHGYVEMRRIGQNAQKKVVTATPRQLESLIRLAEALARMRFSAIVEQKDVQEARRLMSVATQRAATDPTTGLIDMDLIATGHSSGSHKQQEEQMNAIRTILEPIKKPIKLSFLLRKFNESSDIRVSMADLRDLVLSLEADQFLKYSRARESVQRV